MVHITLLMTVKTDCLFLEIFGKIANDEWYKSFEIRNELFLGAYVLMPNHLHTIVIVNKKMKNNNRIEMNDIIVDKHGQVSQHDICI